ncbi:TIL domain-containing protein [Nephila pilipes]|uniref:TIL domain-containing protein n=1 Tax=Nephila pilipes TaxID=299642 RepID=A0A8X6Q966_NEPPI|nr:TIL domain-containing protein [Nephila pilipes]
MKTFLIFCVVALTLFVSATTQCPEHSHEDSCGTACPITCENRNNPPRICTLNCIPGCTCDDGYIQLEDKCVKPSECPN